MPKCKVRLNICGINYLLTADDEEGYVRAIGKEVEKNMESLMEDNPRISMTMAAVLSALSYCDTANKANISADNLRAQLKEYLSDASRYRSQYEEARHEAQQLKKEVEELTGKLSDMERLLAEKSTEPSKAAQEFSAQQKPVSPLKGQQTFTQVSHQQAKSVEQTVRPPLAHKQPKEITPDEFMSFFENSNGDSFGK